RRPIWNIGPASLGDHVLVGLRAEHVHRTSIVADVTVVTQAIGGASADAGASNVGVLALDAPGLRLFEVTVVAGAAQDGAVGADGPVVASVGVAGVNGKANLASGAPPVAAGQPGTHNSACDIPQTQGGNSGNINGASAPGSPAPGGAAGASTVAEAGADGAPQTGVGATGNGGASTSAVDAVTGVLTLTGTGDTGSQGPHGYGGGGGYSSVNGIGSNLYYYAVGGSGGAGGCGGLGGLGGLPGGWSIGILAVSSTGLEIRNGSVTSGNGGNGGAGGPGAAGSAGGRGGSGAIIQNAPNPPSIQSSAGGKGSDGGAGGPGGVGAGGSSVAVYCSASGTIAPAGTTLKTGKVGTGGSGKKAVTTLGCG
ncbi:MAG TPA: hypothetical protein VHE30_11695, partial [Polyangiaceae bacterium]|nr:hypothetical protein [Polyangiaceae bacterium]